MDKAKHAVVQVAEQSSALARDASDAVADSIASTRDYAMDVLDKGAELGQQAGRDAIRSARRIRESAGRFTSAHAFPLISLGLSVGWLAWSIREDSRKRVSPRFIERQPAQQARVPSLAKTVHPSVRNVNAIAVPASALTTTGAKLMGVRAEHRGYDRRTV